MKLRGCFILDRCRSSQDKPDDSIYSYDDSFRITIKNLDRFNNNWFLSIFTFPQNYNLRWKKLNDIFYLINNFNNFYVGSNLDSYCLGNLPFDNDDSKSMADLWFENLVEKKKVEYVDNLFSDCSLWDGIFEIIFSLCLSIILIYCFMGFLNYYRFRKTRHKYNQLIHN